MTQREKVLVGVVGGTFALLLNLFLISFFLKNQRVLREDLDQKKMQYQAMRSLLDDRDVWDARGAWLQAHQPKVEPGHKVTVTNELLEQVRKIAKKDSVQIKPETMSMGTPEKRPYCLSVSVTIETTSTWDALINFLGDLQGPENFIVLENGTFQKDAADPTQMSGKQLRIAKWYAPE